MGFSCLSGMNLWSQLFFAGFLIFQGLGSVVAVLCALESSVSAIWTWTGLSVGPVGVR